MFSRVAIIGLGLIGGSIGLALRKTKAAGWVAGYDARVSVCTRAREMGVVDEASSYLTDVVRGAGLIILATPVGAMCELLQTIAPSLSPDTIVTDVASTKMQVISWAEQFLPPHVFFVGGHPMAGREVSGIDVADAELFKNRIYCLTPTAHTEPAALRKVSSLVETLGARVHFLGPAEHDDQVAGVSHLPFLASVALMQTVVEDARWDEASLLASSGFRDATRLAAGSPEMYRDICLTNSTAIARRLDEYISILSLLRDYVVTHNDEMYDLFASVQKQRQQWQADHEPSE